MAPRNNNTRGHGGPRLPGALRDVLGIKAVSRESPSPTHYLLEPNQIQSAVSLMLTPFLPISVQMGSNVPLVHRKKNPKKWEDRSVDL